MSGDTVKLSNESTGNDLGGRYGKTKVTANISAANKLTQYSSFPKIPNFFKSYDLIFLTSFE